MKTSDEIVEEGRSIITKSNDRGVLLRAMGAMAFRMHCPKFSHFQDKANRSISDMDFASYHQHVTRVQKFFEELGYTSDPRVRALFVGDRVIVEKEDLHADVFFDKLDMCHLINFRGELEKDPLTLPLALLLLEKMQIVKLNEKDALDTSMLLREHAVGNTDNETVNGEHVARLCAADWGLWRTVSMNLNKTKERLLGYQFLSEEDRLDVSAKIDQLLKMIEAAPKSSGWKMRAKIGDRKKWYKEIDEYVR